MVRLGSNLVTSVKEHENVCFIYLSEYDKAMNEIGSEVFAIIKQTMVGNYF